MNPTLRAVLVSTVALLAPAAAAAEPTGVDPLPFPLPLPVPTGAPDEPAPPLPPPRATAAVRLVLAGGTTDLARLSAMHPALLGGGEGAVRAGLTTEWWVAPTIALGGRFVAAADSGAHPGAGATYYFRRALVAEPAVTLLIFRAPLLDIVLTGGVGIAAIREGVREVCLLTLEASCPGAQARDRLAPTASAAFGGILTAAHGSFALLLRFESIGGRSYIVNASPPGGTLETNGLAVTLEAGAGWAW